MMKSGWLGSFAFLALLSKANAQAPQTLNLSSKVQITSVQFKNFADGQPCSGTGDLTLVLPAPLGTTTVAKGLPFAGIVAHTDGSVDKGKTGYAFTSDIPWKNALGSGVDLVLQANPNPAAGQPPPGIAIRVGADGTVNFLSPGVQVTTPFKDKNGNPVSLTATDFNMSGSSQGFELKMTKLTLANVGNAAGSPDGIPRLQACGFGIGMASPNLVDITTSGPHKLTIVSTRVDIDTPIPSFSSGGTLGVSAQNFTIHEDGLPTFDHLSLVSGATNPTAELLASIGPEALLVTSGFATVPIGPDGMTFTLTKIGGSVLNGQIGTDFQLGGLLTLPTDSFHQLEANGNPTQNPAQLPITFGTDSFSYSGTGPTGFDYKPDGGSLDLHVSVSGFTFDDTGVHNLIGTASVYGDSGRIPDGTSLAISGAGSAAGASIDKSGFNGTLTVSTQFTIGGEATITKGTIEIENGSLAAAALSGTLNFNSQQVKDISDPQNPKPLVLPISAAFSRTGMSVSIDATLSPKVLDVDSIGTFTMSYGQVSFSSDPVQPFTFDVSGTLQLNAYKSLTVDVQNLCVSAKGLDLGTLSIKQPIQIPLGPVTANINQIGYQSGKTQDGQPPAPGTPTGPGIMLTGGVDISDSLPISGSVDFNGIFIPLPSNSSDGGSPKIGSVQFQAVIDGVGTIGGSFGNLDTYQTKACQAQTTQFNHCWMGDAQLTIDALGAGGQVNFLFADDGVILLGGNIQMPDIALPGPEGAFLSYYGFGGAFGHGIKYDAAIANASPNDPLAGYSPQPGDWLFQASVYLTSNDDFTIWGPVGLTVQVPDLAIILNGQFALLTKKGDSINPNRYAQISAGFYNDAIRVNGTLNLSVPSLFTIKGNIDSQFGGGQAYIRAGIPVHDNGITVQIGGSGFDAYCKVGAGIDFLQNPFAQGGYESGFNLGPLSGSQSSSFAIFGPPNPGFSVDVAFAGEINFGIASIEASAEGQGTITEQYGDIEGDVTAGISVGPLHLDASIHATFLKYGNAS